MARRIIEKTHNPQTLAYDGSPFLKTMNTLVTPNSTHDAMQDFMGLLTACKVPLVAISIGNVGNGITAFNVQIGGGPQPATGLLVPDNSDVTGPPLALNTALGLCLFQGPTGPQDQPVNLAVAFKGQTFPTSEPDAIFPAGTVFTWRLVSGPVAAGTVRLSMVCIPVDIHKAYPGQWTWGPANVG